jgi:hypothetical protein
LSLFARGFSFAGIGGGEKLYHSKLEAYVLYR